MRQYNRVRGEINGTVRQSKSRIYKVLVHINKRGKKTYFAYYTDGGVMDYCEYDRVKRFISKNHKIRNIYIKNGYQTFIDEIYGDYIKHDITNECNMESHQIKRLNDKSFNFDYNNGLTIGGK